MWSVFFDLSIHKDLVNLLAFFTPMKADWSWLCKYLVPRRSLRAEGSQRFHISKKLSKSINAFLICCVRVLFLFYSPVTSGVHFVLHGLKHTVGREQWHKTVLCW